MTIVDILLEVGAAAVAAGMLLKRRSDEAAVEAELIPIPVRARS